MKAPQRIQQQKTVATFWVNPQRKAGASVEIVDEPPIAIIPPGESWGSITLYAFDDDGGRLRFASTRTEVAPERPLDALAVTISGPRDDVRRAFFSLLKGGKHE